MNVTRGWSAESLPIAGIDGQPASNHLRQARHLSPADSRKEIAEAVVEPDLGVLVVLSRLAGLRREVSSPVGDGGRSGSRACRRRSS